MTTRRFFWLAALTATLAPGCKGQIDLGGGAEADARLTADLFTWECYDPESNANFQGVYAFTAALEYAPDGLQDRRLPGPGGCSADLSMFPVDAGSRGENIPNLAGDAHWATDSDSGRLTNEGPGFYYDEIFNNVHSCQFADELLGGGLQLNDAESLSGVTSPAAGAINEVVTDIDDADGNDAITFGEDVVVSWDSEDWEEVWVQIRQERGGEAWGSVTCNASGGAEFDIGSDVWGLLDSTLNVETINLYVGFQNTETVLTESGESVESATRGVHVLVVQE